MRTWTIRTVNDQMSESAHSLAAVEPVAPWEKTLELLRHQLSKESGPSLHEVCADLYDERGLPN